MTEALVFVLITKYVSASSFNKKIRTWGALLIQVLRLKKINLRIKLQVKYMLPIKTNRIIWYKLRYQMSNYISLMNIPSASGLDTAILTLLPTSLIKELILHL